MCRWAAYIGQSIFVEELLFSPCNSLINQSHSAEEGKTAINADGFGLAWYNNRPEPGLYRDVFPAWSDPNLKSVSHQIQSHLFLAHVRASTGTAISRNNCHPFAANKWSFMHNGQIGGFERFRKKADMLIPEELYNHRKGATDSEVMFLVALGHGLGTDPRRALATTISDLEDMSKTYGDGQPFRMSVAFSDGEQIFAARYASDAFPPTLYYRRDKIGNGWNVVSEPLDDTQEGWETVESGTFCIFDKTTVKKEPLFQ